MAQHFTDLLKEYLEEEDVRDVELEDDGVFALSVGDVLLSFAGADEGKVLTISSYLSDLPENESEVEPFMRAVMEMNNAGGSPSYCFAYDADFNGIVLYSSMPVRNLDLSKFSSLLNHLTATVEEGRQALSERFYLPMPTAEEESA